MRPNSLRKKTVGPVEQILRRGRFFRHTADIIDQWISPKKADSIEILKHEARRRKTHSSKQSVRIGVAWTPCYPEEKKRGGESKAEKLSTASSTTFGYSLVIIVLCLEKSFYG